MRSAARQLAIAPLRLVGARLRSEAIERIVDSMIVKTPIPGGLVRFSASTPLLLDRAATLLVKEPDTIHWIDGFAADSVLWDIGANVGVFSLYAAAQGRGRVIAFEPSAANFHVLTRNIHLNKLDDRVTAYCVALSGVTELGILNLSSTAMGASMSQFGKAGEKSRYWTGDGSGAHGMVGFTVDEFIEWFRPPFPTHIKMDVDGLEWRILQGAPKTLQDSRLRSALIELSLTDLEERRQAVMLLEKSGLRYVSRGEEQRVNDERAANHLFERVGI